MSLPKFNLNRRWINARPGSVLILVIALLVLLALIGTAYLSTTQTERASAQTASLGAEADVLMQGTMDAINSSVGASLYGISPNNGTTTLSSGTTAPNYNMQFRPPGQDMPLPTPNLTFPAYDNYDSLTDDSAGINKAPRDLFLAPRIPYQSQLLIPTWSSLSWPAFGGNSFDSPFDPSMTVLAAANKNVLQAIPTFKTVNGQTYPAILFYVPPSLTSVQPVINLPGGGTYTVTGNGAVVSPYITPSPSNPSASPFVCDASMVPMTVGTLPLTAANLPQISQMHAVVAASASGDGIADSGMFKVPFGQINGITYYASYRCIDNNSAINVNTAWSSYSDPSSTNLPMYGFFPSNIGLKEIMNQTYGLQISAAQEMVALNNYRYGLPFKPVTSTSQSTDSAAYLYPAAQADNQMYSPPSNVGWISYGDMLYNELARRPGNPGRIGTTQNGIATAQWLGASQTAALTHRFVLTSSSGTPSYLEQLLPNELVNYGNARNMPYSPDQAQRWFTDQFALPGQTVTSPPPNIQPPTLRPLLTTENPVSNAVPSRFNNASSNAPVPWVASNILNPFYYNFGDWVTQDVSSTGTSKRSFVCIRRHQPSTSNQPQASANADGSGYNSAATAYWAGANGVGTSGNQRSPGLPYVQQALKASVNTASFAELYLAFAQVMTDSVGKDTDTTSHATGTINSWQPPMQPGSNTFPEPQLPMFRSVVRDASTTPLRLLPSQMLQIRAALAAVNTIDLRKGENNPATPIRAVTSEHIKLYDINGGYAFDVEVFGTQKQPYLSELFAHLDAKTPENNFIALKLVNPYPQSFPLTNWAIGSMNRSGSRIINRYRFTAASLTSTFPALASIQAATTTAPGILVLYEGNIPADVGLVLNAAAATPNFTKVSMTGLLTASGLNTGSPNELFIMRPRRNDGSYSSTGSSGDTPNGDDQFAETSSGSGGHHVPAASSSLPNIAELVPVDQIDLTGIQLPNTGTNPYERICYRRASDPTANLTWNNIFPGYYSPQTTGPKGRYFSNFTNNGGTIQGTAGTEALMVNQPTDTPPTPDDTTFLQAAPCNLGSADGKSGYNYTASATSAQKNFQSTYITCPIQLNNTAMGGPNTTGLSGLNTQLFPFGGFARNVDMLQIPFIGAYRITYNPPTGQTNGAVQTTPSTDVVEMNSVTMDSALANDVTIPTTSELTPTFFTTSSGVLFSWNKPTTPPVGTTYPFIEQIGRFCPVGDVSTGAGTNQADFATGANANTTYHYHWARRLFSYLTVQAPHDDYFPNVDPTPSDGSISNANSSSTTPVSPAAYANSNGAAFVMPAPVANTDPRYWNGYHGLDTTHSDTTKNEEDTTGVQGLININTAPLQVLAAVPWVNQPNAAIILPALQAMRVNVPLNRSLPYQKTDQFNLNLYLANAIVTFRNKYPNRPFKSIYDLYNVPEFMKANDVLLNAITGMGPANGVFSPGAPLLGQSALTTTTPTGITRYDFLERFLLLNNVSNLITTRSDTYTCYVLLQGYRNAGTGNPTLAVQRRATIIVDRGKVTPSNTAGNFTTLPNQ